MLNCRNYDIPAAEMENAFGETVRALGLLSVRCVSCGCTPENQAKPPKFCPECGKPLS